MAPPTPAAVNIQRGYPNEGSAPTYFDSPLQEQGIIIPRYEYVTYVQGQTAASAYAVSTTVYVAPNDGSTWQLVAASEVHGTASSSGTLQVEVATGTQAIASGTNQLTGTMSSAGTAATTVNGTVIGTPTVLAAGNRINLIFAGTVTGLLNSVVTLVIQRLT